MSEEKRQTIGEELSAARQAHGLELEEVQKKSGVSIFVLQGIEADDLEVVEPVFVRLALKAYAECLDLDPDPFLSRFDQQYGRIMQARSRPVVVLSQPTQRRSHKPLIVTGSIIGACCILAVVFFYLYAPSQPPTQAPSTPTQAADIPTQTPSTPTQAADTSAQSQPAATPSDPSVQSSTEPDAADPIATTAAAQATEPAPVVLELEARDSTWVQIRWDNAAENFEAIVPPGERHRFEARDHFDVLSTRPHGLRYWLNGQLLGDGQLGDPNQVLRFRATADSIKFLEPIRPNLQPPTGEAPDAQP